MSTSQALIGYTGFVGSNLARQHNFTDLYNSKNIERIQGKSYDLLVCAGAPGVKWLANKEPDQDRISIERLISSLTTVTTKKAILISTIDVYPFPRQVTEDTPIDIEKLSPYGKHRYMLEEFVSQHFDSLTVRLPGIFGPGLKKNPIYDLMHGSLQFIDHRSILQFYYLNHLWSDIEKALEHGVATINLVTEPLSLKEIAHQVFKTELTQELDGIPATYDVHSRYHDLWGNAKPYLYSKDRVLSDLISFTQSSV